MTVAVRTGRPLLVRHEVCADPLRRTEVLVGHPARPEPQVTSLHWGGECVFGMRLVEDGPGWPRMEHHEGLTLWRKGDVSARFYPTAGMPDDEDGGFEFEVELARRPVSNVLRFVTRSHGLRFFFQRDGSYAVYHASMTGNFTDVHYRAGKACHLYRPWAQDANGLRVWCDLRMPFGGNGLATLTIPRWFLEDAAYPVVVDPTFGYTTAGASVFTITAGQGVASLYDRRTGVTGDVATSVSAHLKAASAGPSACYGFLYTVTSSLPASIVSGDAQGGIGTSYAWFSFTQASQSLTNGTIYCSAVGWNASGLNMSIHYDAGSAGDRSTDTTGPNGTWINSSSGTEKLSIYATYTVPATPVAGRIVRNVAAVQRAANW